MAAPSLRLAESPGRAGAIFSGGVNPRPRCRVPLCQSTSPSSFGCRIRLWLRHSGADGSPHTVVTWYAWEENPVLLSMDESRLRLRFMRRDPRVALTVLDARTGAVTSASSVVSFRSTTTST